MRIFELTSNQRTAIFRAFVIYGTAVILLAAMGLQPWVKINKLTRDITQVAEVGPWTGILSQVGALLWAAAATICLFCSFLLKSTKKKGGFSFLFYSGILTLFLLFDDLFLLHDWIAPKYLNLDEVYILAIYPIAILYLLIAYKKEILASSYFILLSSLGFMALSMLVDTYNEFEFELQFFLEDGLKFLGIIGWLIYFADTGFRAMVAAGKTRDDAKSVKNDSPVPV